MDSHVWREIYQTVRRVDRQIPKFGRRPTFSDVLITGMYLWSVAHDRPLCWACRRSSYHGCFRPRRLPSVSQFCKRVKTRRCEEILQRVHETLTHMEWNQNVSFIDGRALPVGSHSKDPDARCGRGSGGFARGYKLHVWATEDGRIPVWSVMPLNVNEKPVAHEMLRYQLADGLVLADGEYDSRALYDAVAGDGGALLTPLPKNAGRGHIPQSQSRNEASVAWRGIAGYVYRARQGVERIFAHLSASGGGLSPLPPWVRTLPRVRRWVGAKLIIYHARWNIRKHVA
jgi:hypothetical protein